MTFNRGNRRAAKLNGETVVKIRQLYAQGWTQGELSREYDISIGQIGRIVRNEVWQNVGSEPITRAPPSGGVLPSESEVIEGAGVMSKFLEDVNKELQKTQSINKSLDNLKGDPGVPPKN